MTEDWIWLWFRCLKLNKPFKVYCEARRAKNQNACRLLERQHPKIREVYKDFGDIHAFNERVANRKHWHEWLNTHSHLFTTTTITKGRQTITTAPKYELAFKQAAGKVQLTTAKRCLSVWHRLEPKSGTKKPTVPELAMLFAGHKLGDPKYWDDWSEAKIVRKGNLEEHERQILRYRQKGQRMIDNTVDGVFPVYH